MAVLEISSAATDVNADSGRQFVPTYGRFGRICLVALFNSLPARLGARVADLEGDVVGLWLDVDLQAGLLEAGKRPVDDRRWGRLLRTVFDYRHAIFAGEKAVLRLVGAQPKRAVLLDVAASSDAAVC